MSCYTLFIKLEDNLDQEIIDYYKNYETKHNDDSGFDLPAIKDYTINSKKPKFGFLKSTGIKFGISCCMYDSKQNKYVGYYLYPRSSFHKYNLMVANHLGIIDAGYRGPITGMVKPLHLTDADNIQTINKGNKLFQICAPDLSPFNIEIMDILPSSSRGKDGFGSTGK